MSADMESNMELQLARQIIDTLAQGINPITGEAMPHDSPYNAPPIIRALHAVTRGLDRLDELEQVAASKPKRPTYPNGGKAWTPQEDAALEVAFDAGIEPKQVARELGRSVRSVEQRLKHLGKTWTCT